MLSNISFCRKMTGVLCAGVLVLPGQYAAPVGIAFAQSPPAASAASPAPLCNQRIRSYKCPPPAQTAAPAPAARQRSYASATATPTPTSTPTPSGTGISPWWLIGIGGALAVVAATRGGGRDRGGDARGLDENGPRFVDTYPVGSFAIRGFAKDGWPVVLDFRPEPNTRTTMDVVFSENKIASIVVDTNGLAGRHLDKFAMPANGWARKKPKPADYVLRSVYIAPSPRAGQAAPLEVFGIGGGPRAVGSVAIEQLSIRTDPRNPSQPVQFAFNAKSPFNHVRSEVVRFDNDGEEIRLSRVMQVNDDDVGVGPHAGSWDGRIAGSSNRSVGTHRFQVRGWFTQDDKSWVGAVAPTLLRVN